MLLESRGGPLHCGITSPACGSLCLRSWRELEHMEGLRSCEPSPLVTLLPPCTSLPCPGYSHVGFRGVRQGDAEVGNVLEDRIGRGEAQALQPGCHRWSERGWQCLCSSPTVAYKILLPPHSIPPAWGWDHTLPGVKDRARGHQQLVGEDGKQEEPGELEIVSCQCSRSGYSHMTANFPCRGATQPLWNQ